MINNVLPISTNGQRMKNTDVVNLNVFHILDIVL